MTGTAGPAGPAPADAVAAGGPSTTTGAGAAAAPGPPVDPVRDPEDATRAIGGVVRLLCDVRLAVLALGFVSLLADAAAAGAALVIGLLAVPFSYVPARSWERRGALFSRSGILLAADMVTTVIVVVALRGSELVVLYGAATIALLGVTVGLRLALYMATPIALAHLATTVDVGRMSWVVAAVGVVLLVGMAWAGAALGTALRTQAVTARHLRAVQAERAVVLERVRLARDLHDTVAGDLAGAALLSTTLRRRLEQDGAAPDLAVLAEQLDRAVHTAHADTRTALGELRRAGVRADTMLTTVCEQWAHRTGTVVDAVVDPGLAGVASALADDLRAVLLELLENVRRHAGAGRVVVLASATGEGVVLEVTDDGCGFPAGAGARAGADADAGVPRAGHFGLLGITERVAAHGGTVGLTSRPGCGTTVRVHVPGTPAAGG